MVKKRILPVIILLLQIIFFIIFSYFKWIKIFEIINYILIPANIILVILILFNKINLSLGISTMIIIASHTLIGQKISPDYLTSGAILISNILIVYVGINIYKFLSRLHFIIFCSSFLILYFIFIIKMQNAQSLFILSLLGLACTARNFRLLSYFWALVISFTVFQPYSWQSVIILFFVFKMVFSIEKNNLSITLVIFFISGLLFLFFVLFPVIAVVMDEDYRNIVNVLKNHDVINAFIITLISSGISVIILLLFGVPFSYALSRLKFTGKNLLLSLIDIPIIIPQSAAGIMLLKIFGKQQYIGGMIYNLTGIRFDGTILGIILAQIFVAMPFMIKSALSAFDSIPVSLDQTAQNLGASPFKAFIRVVLPLASNGILIGLILSWARAAGEFGAVLLISGSPQSAPILIYNKFLSIGLYETTPLVVSLILFSLILFLLLQHSTRFIPFTLNNRKI